MIIRRKVNKNLIHLKMESSKEIKIGDDVRENLRNGINKLANTVSVTIGPMGKTVIIADEYGDPYITKDGVSVSNYISFENPIENIAATLLKQVAKNTVEQAGDGTTTSICLAQSFINTGFDLLEDVSYNDIKKQLEDLESIVVEQLFTNSKNLNDSNIIDVAIISSNNDKKIGKLINDAYSHSKIIKIEEGINSEDELVMVTGMQLDTTYVDKAFINDGAKQSIEYGKTPIILIDGKLERIEMISGLLKQVQSVIIIADYFSEQIVSLLKDNYNRGALNVALVKSPGFGQHRRDLMQDLAIYTNASLLDTSKEYFKMDVVGQVDGISVKKDKTIISVSSINDLTNERLEQLIQANDITEKGHDKDMLNQRITNLTGNISLIRVGGNSEVEMKERRDRIEDAVLAVLSALEEGIVEGGGVALKRIADSKLLSKNRFRECITAPYNIISNSTDKFLETDDLFKLNIIDPLKVTRCALQNAISVAKTILGTEAVVLNERLWR